jgi:hypothetical protein
MYNTQFQISQPCETDLCRYLRLRIHEWMQHDINRSERFSISAVRSLYDTYDISHLNFVSTFHQQYSCCLVRWQSFPDRNWICWLSYRLMRILKLSHRAFNPCTCTEKWLYFPIWSPKVRKSWDIAKLVNKLLFTDIWCQKLQFAYPFLRWCSSSHHVFVWIHNLYGDLLDAICRCKCLQV